MPTETQTEQLSDAEYERLEALAEMYAWLATVAADAELAHDSDPTRLAEVA